MERIKQKCKAKINRVHKIKKKIKVQDKNKYGAGK